MGYDFELEEEIDRVTPVHGPGGVALSIEGRVHRAVLTRRHAPAERARPDPHDPIGGEADEGIALRAESTLARHRTYEAGAYWLELDGRREPVFLAARGDLHFVHLRGRTFRIHAINALERAREEAAGEGNEAFLRAPMPGTVVDIAVAVGDVVESGARLMTIESMKLETAIDASFPARIAEVFVSTGGTFDQGDPLVRLERAEANPNDGDPPGPATEEKGDRA